MSNPGLTKEQLIEAAQAYISNEGNKTQAANALGLNRKTYQNRITRAMAQFPELFDPTEDGFEFSVEDQEASPLPDIDELVERRKKQYEKKKQYHERSNLINVKVKLDGPIGITHFGDPHVDDDGTDIFALEHHTKIVTETEGMFGANVGDTTNNWVGRLGRLYSEQSTTAAEAWQLAEWFLRRVDWLYIIGGNHDAWSGAGDPIKWITRNQSGLFKPSQIRINLIFPNGREVRVNARHDFPGTSMWNKAHGSMKAAQMGFRDHILVNGHRHTSAYGLVKCPASGIISHCIQVASYKVYDRYAEEKGFMDHHISPCAVTIIDPYAETERGLVHVHHDAEEAAEYLTYKRRKFKG